ncbi:hypothetical protein IWX46DRAFT_208251 [Phyllosticta citricarpa]|uniref:Transmembrane protein n=1 Tax=Phyllosticta citricarpa TaxID=55181 RepID=A0ABR1LWT5_9PEZI
MFSASSRSYLEAEESLLPRFPFAGLVQSMRDWISTLWNGAASVDASSSSTLRTPLDRKADFDAANGEEQTHEVLRESNGAPKSPTSRHRLHAVVSRRARWFSLEEHEHASAQYRTHVDSRGVDRWDRTTKEQQANGKISTHRRLRRRRRRHHHRIRLRLLHCCLRIHRRRRRLKCRLRSRRIPQHSVCACLLLLLLLLFLFSFSCARRTRCCCRSSWGCSWGPSGRVWRRRGTSYPLGGRTCSPWFPAVVWGLGGVAGLLVWSVEICVFVFTLYRQGEFGCEADAEAMQLRGSRGIRRTRIKKGFDVLKRALFLGMCEAVMYRYLKTMGFQRI